MNSEPNCVKKQCINYKRIAKTGDETTAPPHCIIYPDGIPDDVAYCSVEDFDCEFRRNAEPDPEWDEEW